MEHHGGGGGSEQPESKLCNLQILLDPQRGIPVSESSAVGCPGPKTCMVVLSDVTNIGTG